MSTNTSSVTNHFPKPQDGFTTTTSGSISSGATTVGLNSTGSYTNGDIFVGIIEPGTSGKEQTFTGIVDTSGVQITGVKWTRGTNVAHSAGVTVVDYVTATHLGMISKGILVAHNQDGTHKSGATYTLPTITDFTNATHTHATTAQGGVLTASALGTDSSWAWTSWTPVYSAITVGTGGSASNQGYYTQIGKTVFAYWRTVLGSSGSSVASSTITLPVTAARYISQPLGTIQLNGASTWLGTPQMQSTTTALIIMMTAATQIRYDTISSTTPFTWGSGHSITGLLVYEAA